MKARKVAGEYPAVGAPSARVERLPGTPVDVWGFSLLEYSNGRVHCVCRFGACPFSHWFDWRLRIEIPGDVLGLLEAHFRTHHPEKKRGRR